MQTIYVDLNAVERRMQGGKHWLSRIRAEQRAAATSPTAADSGSDVQEAAFDYYQTHQDEHPYGPDTADEMLGRLKSFGESYAEAHAEIPVFNEVQTLARDAAIAVGQFNFQEAAKLLAVLKKYVDEGPKAWSRRAMDRGTIQEATGINSANHPPIPILDELGEARWDTRHPKGHKLGGRFAPRSAAITEPVENRFGTVSDELAMDVKETAMREVASRIEETPLIREFAKEFRDDADPSAKTPCEVLVDACQTAWAQNSTAGLSKAMQERARTLFNLESARKKPPVPKSVYNTMVCGELDKLLGDNDVADKVMASWKSLEKPRPLLHKYVEEHLWKDAEASYLAKMTYWDKWSPAIDSYLKALYGRTQEVLKAHGVKSVKLFRGMTLEGYAADNLGPEGDISSPAAAVHGKPRSANRNTVTNPLSSYSVDLQEAIHFAEMGLIRNTDRAVVISQDIPADQIIGMYLTGLGCRRESEFVVLGGKRKAQIITYPARPYTPGWSVIPAMSVETLSNLLESVEEDDLGSLDLDATDLLADWLIHLGSEKQVQEARKPPKQYPAGSPEGRGGEFAPRDVSLGSGAPEAWSPTQTKLEIWQQTRDEFLWGNVTTSLNVPGATVLSPEAYDVWRRAVAASKAVSAGGVGSAVDASQTTPKDRRLLSAMGLSATTDRLGVPMMAVSQAKRIENTRNGLTHKKAVEKAISEGVPVPTQVLKDYPDLKAKSEFEPRPGGAYDAAYREIAKDPEVHRLLLRENDPWSSNNVTVGMHTLSVLKHHEQQADPEHLNSVGKSMGIDLGRVLTNALVLHDVGKPLAIAAGNKSRQHEFTGPIMDRVLSSLGFSQRDLSVARAFLDHDILGEVVKGYTSVKDAAKQLSARAESIGMDPDDFARIQSDIYLSDVAAYPRMKARYLSVSDRGKMHFKDNPTLDRIMVALGTQLQEAKKSPKKYPKGAKHEGKSVGGKFMPTETEYFSGTTPESPEAWKPFEEAPASSSRSSKSRTAVVPKNHGKLSGKPLPAGDPEWNEALEVSYQHVKPHLQELASKYFGKKGDKVPVLATDLTSNQQEELCHKLVPYISEHVESVVKDGYAVAIGKTQQLFKNTYRKEIENAIRAGSEEKLKELESQFGEGSHAARGLSEKYDDILRAEELDKLVTNYTKSEEWGPFLKSCTEGCALEYARAMTTDTLKKTCDDLNVPLPTITIGEKVPWEELPPSEHRRITDAYKAVATPTDDDRLVGEAEVKGYLTLGIDTNLDWDHLKKTHRKSIATETTRAMMNRFDELSGEEKLAAAEKLGIPLATYGNEPAFYNPYGGLSDPTSESQAKLSADYKKLQRLSDHLQTVRTVEIAKDLGIDISEGEAQDLAIGLWSDWKSDSGSDMGLALQESCFDQLGAAHRTTKDRQESAAQGFQEIPNRTLGPKLNEIIAKAFPSKEPSGEDNPYGFTFMSALKVVKKGEEWIGLGSYEYAPQEFVDSFTAAKKFLADSTGGSERREKVDAFCESLGRRLVAAHVRATWETSQFVLDKAGIRDQLVPLYRALVLSHEDIARGEPTAFFYPDDIPKLGGEWFGRYLSEFENNPNGCQSTSRKLSVCNEWRGAGGIHLDEEENERVVLRILAPASSVLSLPCFGQNVYSEQEVVLTGNSWAACDVWATKAPNIVGDIGGSKFDSWESEKFGAEVLRAASAYYQRHKTLRGFSEEARKSKVHVPLFFPKV